MSLDAVIMLFGALIAIMPFMGFPNAWDDVFFAIAGLVVIALGIAVRRRIPYEPRRRRARRRPEAEYAGEGNGEAAAYSHEAR